MTPDRLAELAAMAERIKEMEAAATPAPWCWQAQDNQTLDLGTMHENPDHGLNHEHLVLWCVSCKSCADRGAPCGWPKKADSDLIATIRNAHVGAAMGELVAKCGRLHSLAAALLAARHTAGEAEAAENLRREISKHGD